VRKYILLLFFVWLRDMYSMVKYFRPWLLGNGRKQKVDGYFNLY